MEEEINTDVEQEGQVKQDEEKYIEEDDTTINIHTICSSINVGFLNTKGAAHLSAREKIVFSMKKLKLQILLLAEVHINSNSIEQHDGFDFIFSTNVSAEQIVNANNIRAENSKTPKGKGKTGLDLYNLDAEKLGMAVVYSHDIKEAITDIIQHDNRNITLQARMLGLTANFTGTHAPHAGASQKQKHDYYKQLNDLADTFGNQNIHLILGDLNARVIENLPGEFTHIGQHVLKSEGATVENTLSPGQQQNREMFMDFIFEKDYYPMNTWFEKPIEQLATFRAVGTKDFKEPFALEKYAQIDFALINKPWKNAIKDCNTTEAHAFDTDHKMIHLKMKAKLASKGDAKHKAIPKYRVPTEEQNASYNQQLYHMLLEKEAEGTQITLECIAELCKEAAKETLTKIPKEQRKEFISANTWEKMEAREKLIKENKNEEAFKLNQEIKNQIKAEKQKEKLRQLEEIDEQKNYKWDGLKRLRAKFVPKNVKFKDKHGRHMPSSLYAKKAAEYLSTEQWAKADSTLPTYENKARIIPEDMFKVKDDDFTEDELNYVIGLFKNNKAPGPDETGAELIKWLDDKNRKFILKAANHILNTGTIEDFMQQAEVVSIFKKGDASKLGNYRPISLLQTMYKIVAALIKERLDAGLDEWLMKTQYGFRKNKSTAQALFLARRLMDLSEKNR